MKKRLTNNLGLKLGSVIAAAFLWLIVVNIDDPIIKKPFGPIPVSILNESSITGEGKVYQILDESDVIYIRCEGNRSVIEKLDSSDFTATANMEDLTFLDTVPIDVAPNKNIKGIEIISPPETLKVSIEDAETKQMAMTVTTKGTPQAGYAVGALTVSPNIVGITGPTSIVKKVSQIRAEVNVDNWNEDGKVNVVPKLYDSYGDEVNSSRVKFTSSEVTVSVAIDETKTVGFSFSTSGEAAEGFRYTRLTYEPTEVVIAGGARALDNVNVITVPDSVINIDGATGNMEKVIDITDYLPSEVRLVDDSYASVLVTVHIEQLEAKTVNIPVGNIELLNLSEDLNSNFNRINEIPLTVRGLKEDLDDLDINQITGKIELENLLAGEYSLPVMITLPETYEVIGEVLVEIVLTDKNNTNPGTIIDNGTNTEPPEEETGTQPDGENTEPNTETNTDEITTTRTRRIDTSTGGR